MINTRTKWYIWLAEYGCASVVYLVNLPLLTFTECDIGEELIARGASGFRRFLISGIWIDLWYHGTLFSLRLMAMRGDFVTLRNMLSI